MLASRTSLHSLEGHHGDITTAALAPHTPYNYAAIQRHPKLTPRPPSPQPHTSSIHAYEARDGRRAHRALPARLGSSPVAPPRPAWGANTPARPRSPFGAFPPHRRPPLEPSPSAPASARGAPSHAYLHKVIEAQAEESRAVVHELQQQRAQLEEQLRRARWEVREAHHRNEQLVRRVSGAPLSHAPQASPSGWTAAAWLASLGAPSLLADALLSALHSRDGAGCLASLRAIASADAALSLLSRSSLLERLAQALSRAAAALRAPPPASAPRLADKFVLRPAEGVLCTRPQLFFSGLDGGLGATESIETMPAMEREHTALADARESFLGSYETRTTSAIEWWFVVDPANGLRTLGLSEWPADAAAPAHHQQARQPRPLADFTPPMRDTAQRLAAVDCTPLVRDDLIAARLYTGPMYTKYKVASIAVRSPDAALAAEFGRLCHGNRYTATLHRLNCALLKLGRIQRLAPVYRCLAGGVLPQPFREMSETLSHGCIEMGLMSATEDWNAAAQGAAPAAAGQPSFVLEIEQGLVDRGASLQWLSQYPNEAEVAFPPLTALKVVSSRVEGAVVLVKVAAEVHRTSSLLELEERERRRAAQGEQRAAPAAQSAKAKQQQITQRVARQGGKSGVIAVSLMWKSPLDLDLRVVPPSGKAIDYKNMEHSGGKLDIDMRTGNKTDEERVENISFSNPEQGKYVVSVFQNSDAWTVGVKVKERYYVFEGTGITTVCTFVWNGGADVASIAPSPGVTMY
ncbi:hypothetical protein AB1Y20_016582 [Prymnesium parvum]|uniref:NAD(+)--protein-arginine ADP-ribosyltransferase n=1 Tax=Prymnesium parvum TaxID=97485 RepID=A0AB34ICW6_PRYPA